MKIGIGLPASIPGVSGDVVLEWARQADSGYNYDEQGEGEIHLLIADLVMPQMSGNELAERILALWPNIRVLFISGYNYDEQDSQGQGLTTAFLEKPFSATSLLHRVRQVLDQPSPAKRQPCPSGAVKKPVAGKEAKNPLHSTNSI